MQYYGRPLTVKAERGRLVIEIGVDVLAHAVSYADWANPFNEEENDYLRSFAITDASAFAKDVARAALDEREDGSSLLTDFLDRVTQLAVDDGSEACEHEQRIQHGHTSPLETWAVKRRKRTSAARTPSRGRSSRRERGQKAATRDV